MNGIIFDIKEFSIHDGPSGRITVFLKGCPLRCVWSHNPERLSVKPQLMYKENLCTHCRMCEKECSHEECKQWGRYIHICANNALSVAGKEISSDELSEKLLSNKDFLEISGGGVTVSGGEPMLQSEFVCELADKLSPIHKAIQTSGFTDENTYRHVIDKFDYIMQDIKIVDEKLHEKYTGVNNKNILKTLNISNKAVKSLFSGFRLYQISRIPMKTWRQFRKL